jgi:hypothetical protein
VEPGPLELEIGPRLDPLVAMYPMLLFRLSIQASLSLESHPVAVSVAHFIGPLTQETHGLRWSLWTA